MKRRRGTGSLSLRLSARRASASELQLMTTVRDGLTINSRRLGREKWPRPPAVIIAGCRSGAGKGEARSSSGGHLVLRGVVAQCLSLGGSDCRPRLFLRDPAPRRRPLPAGCFLAGRERTPDDLGDVGGDLWVRVGGALAHPAAEGVAQAGERARDCPGGELAQA